MGVRPQGAAAPRILCTLGTFKPNGDCTTGLAGAWLRPGHPGERRVTKMPRPGLLSLLLGVRGEKSWQGCLGTGHRAVSGLQSCPQVLTLQGKVPQPGLFLFWTNPGMSEPPAGWYHLPPHCPDLKVPGPVPTWSPHPVTRQPGRALCLLPRGLPMPEPCQPVGKPDTMPPTAPRACSAACLE